MNVKQSLDTSVHIEIVTRDANGNKYTYFEMWDKMYEFLVNSELDEEEEILCVVIANRICLYSSLTSAPITWNDVIGFLA